MSLLVKALKVNGGNRKVVVSHHLENARYNVDSVITRSIIAPNILVASG